MKPVIREGNGKYVSGLCGGIARAMEVDPVLVRMAVVFLTLISGLIPGILTYLFGWLITPMEEVPAPMKRMFSKPGKENEVAEPERVEVEI